MCYRYLTTRDQMLSVLEPESPLLIYMIVKETCYRKCFNVNLYEMSDRSRMERDLFRFFKIVNLPNCIGAIDGKYMTIQAPPNSGAIHFNYKKTFN